MKLPKQSAPVQRNISGTAISSGSGVEASANWVDIINTAATAAQLGTGIAGLFNK